MKGNVIEQAASYRRGLVLGLTMAEVILLVIFILLLVLGTLLALKEKERRDLETKLHNQEVSYVLLEDKIKPWLSTMESRDPDDLFQELRRASDFEAEVERLKSRLTESEKAQAQAESVAQAAKEALKNDDAKRMAEVLAENRRLQQEGRNKDGQLANLRERLKGPGGGTEHPPCWATPEGKIEYIYDVALTSTGYIVREINIPHRAEEKKRLPLQGITLGTEIPNKRFMQETTPLFEWSKAHDCRFFVKAFDRTGPQEKAIYNRQRRTLEQHFYKYEVRNDPF